MKNDLKAVRILERRWYEEAQHRKQWYVTCNERLSRRQHDQQRRREMVPCDVSVVCVVGASGGSLTRQQSAKRQYRCRKVQ